MLLPDGSMYMVRFEEDVLFGSLRPVKRGGKKEYYCRECYAEKGDKATSIIPLKTPHWTQSMYPGGVEGDSRITTRLCDWHTREYLRKMIPVILGDSVAEFTDPEFDDMAIRFIEKRNHLKLSKLALDVALQVIFNEGGF